MYGRLRLYAMFLLASEEVSPAAQAEMEAVLRDLGADLGLPIMQLVIRWLDHVLQGPSSTSRSTSASSSRPSQPLHPSAGQCRHGRNVTSQQGIGALLARVEDAQDGQLPVEPRREGVAADHQCTRTPSPRR